MSVEMGKNKLQDEGIEGNTFVVTGGLGFVGSALCSELIQRGAKEVRTLDCRSNSSSTNSSSSPRWSSLDNLKRISDFERVKFIQGDVRRKEDVDRALRGGVNCVFHIASYGMSGKEMVQGRRVEDVNINGTSNVLDACLEFGIKRLVYVSTYNVVFCGKNEIVNGNEDFPYTTDHCGHHTDDPFGCSKSVAEQLVLKSNGRLSKENSTHLYTCAVRPAIIYGPGDERHTLSRIVLLAKLGLLTFRIGEADVKTDWVYLDNLVHALILASMCLLDSESGRGGQPVAGGQPYFISDGYPINSFEFIQPLLRSLDYDLPKSTLDVHHALLFGRIFWDVYRTLLYAWLESSWLPQPPIVPPEVYKVGVTHYFSYHKAKEELGYEPMVSPQEGMSTTIAYWQEKKRRTLDGPTVYAWLFCLIGLPFLFAAACLPDVSPVKPIKAISLTFYRSMRNLQITFFIVATVHIGEAIAAWFLAKRVDPGNVKGWFWQTLILATFSFRFLWKRARNKYKRN